MLSDEDLQGLGTTIAQTLQTTQPQGQTQQTQYTPEQIDELLHVWKPDATWYEEFAAGGDRAMKAVLAMRDGLMKQNARRLQLELAQLREELSPGLHSAQEMAVKAREDAYYKANPDLDKHRDVVEMTFSALKRKGSLNGKSQSEVQKIVADETRAWLKAKGIVSAAPNGAAPNGRKVPAQLSQTSASTGSRSAETNPTVAALRRVG